MVREFDFEGFDLNAKIEKAICIIRENAPKDRPYYLAFSGGKDSIVLKELAIRSGVDFKAHYNVTTIDPPELVRFIREYHPDVNFNHPGKNFFKEMEIKGWPSRIGRWCCEEFKESRSPKGSVVLVGVRWEESVARSKRWNFVTWNDRVSNLMVAPILDWRLLDIWDFIERESSLLLTL